MALTATTLSAAINISDTLWPLTSSTGFLVGQPIRLDNEYAYVVSAPTTTSVIVRNRGSEGSTPSAHQILTNVITGLASDFPAIPPGLVGQGQQATSYDDMVTLGANTAIIGVPIRNTAYLITKATALASTTLAAPTTAQNGIRLTFTSTAAVAHVITTAALFNNGITGGPWSTATFAAFVGAGFSAIAENGLWMVTAIPIAAATAFT
jgi:hypothetical protein